MSPASTPMSFGLTRIIDRSSCMFPSLGSHTASGLDSSRKALRLAKPALQPCGSMDISYGSFYKFKTSFLWMSI